MESDRTTHWENVYISKKTTEVSWFEPEPTTSLLMIERLCPHGGRIIDVGGGASFLVDRLLENGLWDVTVLDVSPTVLRHTRDRIGNAAIGVHWLCGDITQTSPLGEFDLWHDRAVFHFLTSDEDRRSYLDRLQASLMVGGFLVLATFALDGPEKCSGLPVCRYDVAGLQRALGNDYALIAHEQPCHVTPSGKPQQFTLAAFQKR